MNRIKETLAKAGFNTFFFLLLFSLLLAYLFPEWGDERSMLPLEDITYYGVAVIFFFYGVKISPRSLLEGLANWKLHLLVQLSTFLLFPLLILSVYAGFGKEGDYYWLGTFYLAALPSTVSSSVVMVSIARGNLPAAIFNASFSSILGIFITPIWMGMFLSTAATDFELMDTFIKLIKQILIPVIAGLFLHAKWGEWTKKYAAWLKRFDQTIILLIVFSAFASSFGSGMFDGQPLGQYLMLGLWMSLLFFLVMGLMHLFGKKLGLPRKDRITVLFCGSKKSLVQGAVMGKILFPNPTMFGVVLLPLMIYHTLQLIYGSALAEKMGAKKEQKVG